jgi:hypothetical protein
MGCQESKVPVTRPTAIRQRPDIRDILKLHIMA